MSIGRHCSGANGVVLLESKEPKTRGFRFPRAP
nr:MAG TPA: hypothetical protein [Caudoviricetes sp.]